MDTKNIFASRVQELRKQKRLTQTELGDAIGLTQKAISTIESGVSETTFGKLVLLAKFFQVSTDYLLGLTDEP